MNIHIKRLLLNSILVLMIAILGACGSEDDDNDINLEVPTEAQESDLESTVEVAQVDEATEISGTAEPAGDALPTATYIPTAVIEVPKDVDREFEDSDEMQERRTQLVERQIEPVVSDQTVIDAMHNVPRHSFVPTNELNPAYNDHPLPIGYGQTISQPSLVAMMTELLQLEPGDRVLEIGTGSGYQAAILREITDEVYTVEIVPELAAIAKAVFETLGYDDIHLDRRDGYFGWREHAPYDAII